MNSWTCDTPICSAKEDHCDWNSFALSIAKFVHHRDQLDPLCIGIHGPWGSGKSSFVNLIAEQLQKLPPSPIHSSADAPWVMRFNPWILSGQDQLVSYFFNELISFLQSKNENGADRALTVVVDKLLEYRSTIETIALAEPISSLAVKIGMAGLALWKNNKEAPTNIYELKKHVEKALGSNGENELPKFKHHIVIIIDDIDRLLAKEMLVMFQLVKSIADFPNITYILVYEQDMLLRSLKKEQTGKPCEYLEKLIQVSFPVPKIAPSVLQEQLQNAVFTIWPKEFHKYFQTDIFENSTYFERWIGIYHSHIKEQLNNLRQVKRFYNNLLLHFTVLGRDIDPQDLSLWCWFMTIEPDAVEKIHRHLQLTDFELVESTGVFKEKQLAAKEYLEKTFNKKSLSIINTLKPDIFPVGLGKSHILMVNQKSHLPSMSLSKEKNLLRVLQFNVKINEIWSPSKTESILNKCTSENNVASEWGDLSKENYEDAIIALAQQVCEGKGANSLEPLALFFLKNGDNIDDQKINFSESLLWSTLPSFLQSIMSKICDNDTENNTVYKILCKVLTENADTLQTPLVVISRLSKIQRGEVEDAKQSNLLTVQELQELQDILQLRIQKSLRSGQMLRPGFAAFAIYRMREWGKIIEAVELLENYVSNSSMAFVDFLRSFSREYYDKWNKKPFWEFHWVRLSENMPLTWWLELAEKWVADSQSIDEEHLYLLNYFIEKVKKQLNPTSAEGYIA